MSILEYCNHNYKYTEMHEYTMRLVQLKRVLARLGLFRRKDYSSLRVVIYTISKELEGSGQQLGFRFLHQKCKNRGLLVSRNAHYESITDYGCSVW